MCWISESAITVKCVAENDIPCFKLVNEKKGKLTSQYYEKEYSVGETYSEELGKPEIAEKPGLGNDTVYKVQVNKGLHSFYGEPNVVRWNELLVNCEEMLHITEDELNKMEAEFGILVKNQQGDNVGFIKTKSDETRVMKCIIPKGASFFENKHGELVSDTLKVVSANKVDEFLNKKD